MTEWSQLKKGAIKLVCVGICGFLYSLGGMEGGGGIWIRRYLMPAVFTGTLFFFSKSWKSLITLPLFIITLSLGYGADNVAIKILKRFIYGLTNGATSSTFNLTKKQWLLAGVQIICMIILYVAMGVWNPLPNARIEELVLGSALVFLPIMSA
jgi:hypothetical protein